eukprot:GHVS01073944.1.p1 GENE.GHVS01073944.1~~GHVS01073944.1.p1  ORF type:complete len:507 (+),score=37.58 GHVS01073944.1:95-1615(+)
MANRSSAAHFLLIAIAALLLLALSAAADNHIAKLLKIDNWKDHYVPLAVPVLELSIGDEQLLKLEAKNDDVVATVILQGREGPPTKVEDAGFVDKPLVLRTAEDVYVLTFIRGNWRKFGTFSVKADKRNYDTEAEEIVKLLKKEGGNPCFYEGLQRHLVTTRGMFANSQVDNVFHLMLHNKAIYAYRGTKVFWYKIAAPADTKRSGNRETIMLDGHGSSANEEIRATDVTLERKDGDWTFLSLLLGDAATKKRIAENMFFDDTMERRDRFTKSLGEGIIGDAMLNEVRYFYMRPRDRSNGFVYAIFEKRDSEPPAVEVEGEIRRLSMDMDAGEATFFFVNDNNNKPSYRINCIRAGELWDCSKLENWSKQILTAAFDSTQLKDFLEIEDFKNGLARIADNGSISKFFGYYDTGIVIKVTPAKERFIISADSVGSSNVEQIANVSSAEWKDTPPTNSLMGMFSRLVSNVVPSRSKTLVIHEVGLSGNSFNIYFRNGAYTGHEFLAVP